MIRYYKLDGGKLSYSEYWRLSPDPLTFLIVAVRKLFFFPMQFRFGIPRSDVLQTVEEEDLPRDIARNMRAMIRGFTDEDFRLAFYYTTPTLERHRRGFAASMLSDDGLTAGLVIAAREKQASATRF